MFENLKIAKLKILFIVFCSLIIVFTVIANAAILSYGRFVATTIGNVPTTTVALVFGGGMKPNGEMSDMQTDRVVKGIELYRAGTVQTLVMTGDDGAFHTDEVDAMRAYAVNQGVPARDIVLDRHGYRTYDSCYRANHVFGWQKVIAVSQRFHLPRIIYLCSRLGVDTIGVPAEFHVPAYDKVKANVREIGARMKNWLDVELLHPLPRSLSIE